MMLLLRVLLIGFVLIVFACKDASTQIDGAWNFVPGRLLQPTEFANSPSVPVQLPHYWSSNSDDSVGTYQQEFILPDTVNTWTIWVPEQSQTYHLFVDSQLVASKTLGDTCIVLPRKKSVLLTMQVKGFLHGYSGFVSHLIIGQQEALRGRIDRIMLIDMLIIGALFFIGIYQFILFLHRRRLSYMALCLHCILWAMSFFAFGTEGRISLLFFPNLTLEHLYKLEMIPVILIAPLLIAFVSDAFSATLPYWFLRLVFAVGVLATTSFIILPARIMGGWFLDFCHVFALLGTFYSLRALILAFRKKLVGRWALLFAMVVFGVCGINDILYEMRWIQTGYTLQYGTLLLVLCFAFILSKQYAHAMQTEKENETLRQTLARQAEFTNQVSRIQWQLEHILNAIEQPVLTFRESGEILYANKASLDLVGAVSFEVGIQVSSWLREIPTSLGEQDLHLLHRKGSIIPRRTQVRNVTVGDESLVLCVFALDLNEQTQEILAKVNHKDFEGYLDTVRQAYALKESRKDSRLSSAIRNLEDTFAELHRITKPPENEWHQMATLSIQVMQNAIRLWSAIYPEKGKVELARESGLWKVYMNRDGWERTQTLDRYLSIHTFPTQPRWAKVIDTAEFVLATPSLGDHPIRKELVKSLEEFKHLNV